MLQMLYSVLKNLIGNQLLFGLKWIQYTCIGVELYSCSTNYKGNARARSKEEHTVVSTLVVYVLLICLTYYQGDDGAKVKIKVGR